MGDGPWKRVVVDDEDGAQHPEGWYCRMRYGVCRTGKSVGTGKEREKVLISSIGCFVIRWSHVCTSKDKRVKFIMYNAEI